MPKKFLFEDLMAFQDKWATGISGRNVGPQSLTLLDILNRAKGDSQHPNNITAQGPDIYGSQMMVQLLGDLYVNTEKITSALAQTKDSLILRDRPQSQAQIGKILKKVQMIQKLVDSIAHDIDDFSVDKSTK